MTDPRRQRFLPYIRRLADLMGLKDWDVRIDDEGLEDGTRARVYCPHGRKIAEISVSDDFLDEPADSQRQTFVHELLHVHFAAAAGIAETELDEASWRSFLRMFEYGIDGAADAWARSLPLPDPADLPHVNGEVAHAPRERVLKKVDRT